MSGEKDILEFCTAEWGLGLGTVEGVPPLYPAQMFILKCYYGMEPDGGNNRNIIINDQFNENERYRFNEKEYISYLYDEGRINVQDITHAYNNIVLIAGRRSGKCVSEGTYINTKDGFYEIQNLGNPNEPEYQPLKMIVSQEGDKKSESKYFYNGGEKDTIKIKSFYGFGVEGTPNHRIKILNTEGNIQWKYLSDIQKGDMLCVHRKTDLWTDRYVNLDLEFYKNNLIKIKRKEVILPKIFDETWALFLGVLVGDGSWTKKGEIEVTVGPYPEWIKQVQDLFISTVGEFKLKTPKNRAWSVRHFSVEVREFLNRIGFKLEVESNTKRIPWIVWKSPKSVVAAFLRGFFETDGCVEKGKKLISFSTASKKLAEEMQILLLNFGIVCRIKARLNKRFNKTYYHGILIGYESIKMFYEQIGFISSRKKSILQNHISKGYQGNKSSTESIPYQKEWCLKLRESVPKNYYNGWVGKPGNLRCVLKESLGNVIKNTNEDMTYPRIKKVFKLINHKKIKVDQKIMEHFDNLVNTNYFFDEIVEVTQSRAKVYDLNVPDGESFVANGITNHNTTVTSCIIAYETYKLLNNYSPQEYFGIMPEDDIRLTCVSTSKETASELFNKVTGHLDRSEFFRRYRLQGTKQSMYLQTQRDIERYGRNNRATVSIHVAPCSAKGLRGHNNIVVGLDEMAHFFEDEKSKGIVTGSDKNDRSIYNAVTPSVAKFKSAVGGNFCGKIICISSPSTKTGKLYEEYERSFKKDVDDLLMIQAPTWEIDPNLSSEYLRNKFNENPIAFRAEHGAMFDDRLKGWIEDPEVVRQNVVPGLRYKDRTSERVPHFMGIDIGFKEDGTSICIVHHVQEIIQGVRQTMIEVDDSQVRYSELENKKSFVPDELADWIASFVSKFYIIKGLMDQYYGIAIIPMLQGKGLKQFEYRQFNDSLNSEIYQNLYVNFISRTLRFPAIDRIQGKLDSDTKLVSEILTLQSIQKTKYIIDVHAPERAGAHDDLSDALTRAVLLASEYKAKGYGFNMGAATVGQTRNLKLSRSREMMKMSLNRPTRGGMTGRDLFSRSIQNSLTRTRY